MYQPVIEVEQDGGVERRVAARFARQNGVASVEQLDGDGLRRRTVARRVDAGTLHEAYPGVVSPSPVITADGWRTAALLASAPSRSLGAVSLTHWSALELLALGTGDDECHHTTVEGTCRRDKPGLRVHRARAFAPPDLIRVREFRVTAAPRTLLDCAADGLLGRDLEKAVAEAEYLRLLTAESLDEALSRHRGHPGLGALLDVDVVAARRRRTDSPFAEQVRRRLQTLPITEPEGQHRLRGLTGKLYRVDFAWLAQRVIVEADGRSAHARALTLDADRARDNDLIALGWWVMRLTPRQLRDGWEAFAAQLLARLAV